MRYALAVGLAIVATCAHAEESPRGILGLVEKRPAEGHFVETDKGFMVPYESTIPGTEVAITMMPVPGGEYEMTRHGETYRVKIEPFWMGRTEVTWAQYTPYMDLGIAFQAFEDAGVREITATNKIDAVTAPSKLYEPGFTFRSGDDPTQPAVSMSQYSAKQYTKWLSRITEQFYRLPSEAEWEYACRAGSATKYSFGDDPSELGEYAWFSGNSKSELGHVARKKPNAWGLYDMHGNAAEWVMDFYEKTEKSPKPGATVSVADSIAWPTDIWPRTLKGGSWQQNAENCTTTSRLGSDYEWLKNDPNSPESPWWLASKPGQQVGFRLLRPLSAPERKECERYWEADDEYILEVANDRIDEEGRGERGVVDPSLPDAVKNLRE